MKLAVAASLGGEVKTLTETFPFNFLGKSRPCRAEAWGVGEYPPERKVSVTGFFDLAAYRADQARQRGMM